VGFGHRYNRTCDVSSLYFFVLGCRTRPYDRRWFHIFQILVGVRICVGGGEICAVEEGCGAPLAIDVRYIHHGGHRVGNEDFPPLGKGALEDYFLRETAAALCDHNGPLAGT